MHTFSRAHARTFTTGALTMAPGSLAEFEEFEFSAGRLPDDKTSLSFPAVQTYSDGKVVKWNEAQAKGAEEPEHPAPVLNLLPSKVSEAPPAAAVPSVNTGSKDSVARGLGAAAALAAAGGLGLGLRRKRSATS